MATAVGKNKSGHRLTLHDIIETYSFDSSNTDCISNACDECLPNKILMSWGTETSSGENSTTGS